MLELSRRKPSWLRIRETLLFAASVLVAFTALVAVSSQIGANFTGNAPLLEPYRAPNSTEVFATLAAEYALTGGETNDVIFIGDSTCRCGLDPRRFEKLTGLSAYNLGTGGALGIWAQLVTLRVYLEHHPAPRAVVLCLTPVEILRGKPQPPAPSSGGGTSAGEIYERFIRAYGPRADRKSVLADGTDSLKYFVHRGIMVTWALGTAALGGQSCDRRDEPIPKMETETYNTLHDKLREARGYFASPTMHGAGVANFVETDVPHSIRPVVNDGVRVFAELARAHRFHLLIRLAPISAANAPWDSEGIPQWLQTLEHEYPQVVVSRPEILWYDPEECWDTMHVNSRGVERFTAHVAKDVAKIIAQPVAGP